MTNVDRDGDNERRDTPPADPWLETAPTSPIDHLGQPTSVDPIVPASDPTLVDDGPAYDSGAHGSPAHETPAYDGPAYDSGAHHSGTYDTPRRRGRRGWWLVAVAAGLIGCVGGILLNPFDGDHAPDRAGRQPQPTHAPTVSAKPATGANPATGAKPSLTAEANAQTQGAGQTQGTARTRPVVAEPAADQVVYLVSSGGKGDVASVEFTDEDGDIIRKGEVSLPWRYTFRTGGDKPPLVVIAQRHAGGTTPVTCSITLGGKELASSVQRGRSAAPQCSA